MCGVAGIIDFRGRCNSVPEVSSMLRTIRYRGPDESGIYHSRCATIGNVRLSIIDIENGQQPLSDSSGRFWIVFNGEIFNYKELRADLEKEGHTFKTQSDTEVLVQLYAIYGKNCLNRLNGQFAVAIWDTLEQELFIARDRVGIRPLFYCINQGVLYFASEIKAIFSQKHLTRELVPESLIQIYTFWSSTSPATPFRNILELSPGHYLTYNHKGITIERFWQLEFHPGSVKMSFNEAVEEFSSLFSSAVRLRLRADVEVAAYLSGGLDSSATVAYIKKLEPGVLNTFSIGFTEKEFDESDYQNEAVKYFNTNHKSITCTPRDIAEHFPAVVWHSEFPILRTSPTPMLILSKLVRESNIKVVITGEGSDEILAGYDIFRESRIRRFWASQPDSAIRPMLLKKIYPDIPHLRNASPNILKMFFGYKLSDTNNPFYSHILRWNNSNHIKKHLSKHLKPLLETYSPFVQLEESLPDGFMKWDHLAQAQWLEISLFMSGYLLSSQGDRMGMANSVEGRFPFLDFRVIEFCASLPAEYKLRGLNEKYLLKKAMKNMVPESILRRPKQPYRAPIKSVFISETLPEYVEEMLSDTYTKSAGIFNEDSVKAVLNRIGKTGTASETDNMILTAVISTHLLHHQFIKDHNEDFIKGEPANLKVITDS